MTRKSRVLEDFRDLSPTLWVPAWHDATADTASRDLLIDRIRAFEQICAMGIAISP
jgi:hypothetical protein